VSPRRLLLPLYMALPQMPKGFGVPGWAKSAFTNAVLMFVALDLRHHALLTGQMLVGLSIAFHSPFYNGALGYSGRGSLWSPQD